MTNVILLVLAALVLIGSRVNLGSLWGKATSLISKGKDKVVGPSDDDFDIVDTVAKFKALKNALEKAGLSNAVNKLDEVFPLINEDRKANTIKR